MKKIIYVVITILAIIYIIYYINQPLFKDNFFSTELVSSKNEKVYINKLIWGFTGNGQFTIITKNKNKLKNRKDSISAVKGLSPFFYLFKNDTLTIIDNGYNYRIKEKFNSITIIYKPKEQRMDLENYLEP